MQFSASTATVRLVPATFALAVAAVAVGCGNGTPPPPTPVASPATLALTTAGETAPVTVTEAAYSGNFALTIPSGTCTPAPGSTAAPVTVAPTSAPNPATFTVTSVAAGTCALVFSDSNGNTVTVNVTIGSRIIIQSTRVGPR